MHYIEKKLLSNLSNYAKRQDASLEYPRGIVVDQGLIYTVNWSSNYINIYNSKGDKLQSININNPEFYGPPSATGLVKNNNPNQFFILENSRFPSILLTAGEAGQVYAWNPRFDLNNTCIVIDNIDSVYKGLAIATDRLFLADFKNNQIQVYNGNFQPVLFESEVFIPFSDNTIPPDYSAFNVVNIKNKIYVLYAKKNLDQQTNTIDGLGNGYINEFTIGGVLIRRLVSGGELNSPWGLIEAPHNFGLPEHSILVSNTGNGKINAYTSNGKFIKTLKIKCEAAIDGLWGLAKSGSRFYFTAGSEKVNGLVGKIKKD